MSKPARRVPQPAKAPKGSDDQRPPTDACPIPQRKQIAGTTA